MSKTKKHFNHTASGTQSTVSKGRMIEAIVASMHEGDGVKVERNVKLPPIGSTEPTREIDVLLSSEVCGYPVRWAFECKNEKKRIGVEYIDAFVGKLKDVGIPSQFGIFVTTSDYSNGARRQAEKEGIRLLIMKDMLHGIEPDIHHALQSTLFLLPIINGLEYQNFVFDATMQFSEAIVLFNKQGEAITTIPHQIWQAWNDGRILAHIGKSDIELQFSDELYQRVGGKLVPVIKIVVKVSVVALVLQFTGTASFHRLDNIATGTSERQQLKASFDPPLNGRYPLKTIETEEQLEQEILKPAIVAITNRIRLPRINFWNVAYWPPSERVMKIMTKRMQAFEAGLIPDPRPFNISELEGTDLSAIFEPISPSQPADQMKS